MLVCGAAKKDINPDLPIPVTGYGPGRLARRVHDDICVAALYLEERDEAENPCERFAVLTYDMTHTSADFVADVQKRCAEATGLDGKKIMLTASHAHSSPTVRSNRVEPDTPENRVRFEKWRERVVARSAEALKDAISSAAPVGAWYNCCRIRENVNRRVFFPDGTYVYQPLHKNTLPIADGPVDDELGMLYFFRGPQKNNPVAIVANYAAHPLTVGDCNSDVSADYPGALKREIERSMGGTALFITGAAGDNHPLGAEGGYGRCERMGQALAEKVIHHRWDAVELLDPPIACDVRTIQLPAMTREDAARFPAHYGTRAVSSPPPSGEASSSPLPPGEGREREPGEENPNTGDDSAADGRKQECLRHQDSIEVDITLWAVGPIVFIGVPGELSAELGLRLKWESPFAKTYIMYLATEHLGYISHRNAYEWGGYEVVSSRFGPDAGGVLCAQALAAAGDLKKRMEATGRPVTLPRRGVV